MGKLYYYAVLTVWGISLQVQFNRRAGGPRLRFYNKSKASGSPNE